MKKISCIQQYVIDSLIKDNKLSIQNLIYDISAGESKTVYICGIVGYKRVKSL